MADWALPVVPSAPRDVTIINKGTARNLFI
jgi:hypothetical protein